MSDYIEFLISCAVGSAIGLGLGWLILGPLPLDFYSNWVIFLIGVAYGADRFSSFKRDRP